MPDTKTGRERKGRNKRSQLEDHLASQEIETMDDDEDLPSFDGADGEFIADELPSD